MKVCTASATLIVCLILASPLRTSSCAQEVDGYCTCPSNTNGAQLFEGIYGYTPPPPLWMRAEYMHAWVQDNAIPALVTTSPSGTPHSAAGVLGEPGTQTLFGGQPVGGETSGVRGSIGLRLGHYFDCLADWDIETSLMWLGSTRDPGDFAAASGGEPILARPFFDASNGAQNSSLVAFPGVVEGELSADISNELTSIGISCRRTVLFNERLHIQVLAGYRYLDFNEQLSVDQTLGLPPGTPPEQQVLVGVFDHIRARNRFDGGELGIVSNFRRDCWEFELLAKLALGQTRKVLTVDHIAVVDYPDVDGDSRVDVTVFADRYTASDFGVLPEIDFSVHRRLTPDFTLTIGYTLIFLSKAIRLGDHIDTTINSPDLPAELPLAREPGAQSGEPGNGAPGGSSLCVHGIHIGHLW